MSSPRSKLRKILRAEARMEKKRGAAKEQYRKPGETDEQMEARMKRDLFGFLDMMEEREIEEALTTKAKELEDISALESTQSEEEK